MTMPARSELPRRFIPIEGSLNLRDFGGYHTENGRQVATGKLFRGGNMAEIPEHAHDDFAALDIGVICDLRSEEEANNAPTPAGGPFSCRVHIPIWPGSSTQFQDSIRGERKPDRDDFINFMSRVTREIARDHVEAYKQLMRELVNTERGFLLHCSAGKDRTGIGAALILTLLGVNRQIIIHDYLVSNEAEELFIRMRARMGPKVGEKDLPHEVDDEIIRILSGVREEYLHGAFEEIDEHYGGIHGYMEAIGISAADEQHLKDRLLT